MKKRQPIKIDIIDLEPRDKIKFCLNCDDMENLAVSTEINDIDALKDRFRNCDDTGRFDGDLCSRLFVADPGEQPGEIFENE